ncbi:alpha/beta fold hydrolase [uncultured Methanobrevibacter sp.]|uniref:alpha/beta fold hydrolase n=1 Tax=uncultured Methanobrevibacter sp. TaxID=253161 RepID=UPI00261E5923
MAKIKVNDILINYELNGNPKSDFTIVFVHGLSDNLNYWKILSEKLNENYQTLIFDLRGHGESEKGKREITIDCYTEDLFYLLKSLNIDKVVLIGLSLGGNIAMNFTAKHNEMVKGEIIMSSFCEFTPHLEAIFKSFEKAIKIDFLHFYDTIIPYCLCEEILEKNRQTLETIKINASKEADCEGILEGIKAGNTLDIKENLYKITSPTLIIGGEDDELTDIEHQEEIHKNIRNSEIIFLENTKHNLLIGRNIEKIDNMINEFLEKLE